MKLSETRINTGGMLRCCIDTICTLDKDIDFKDESIIDCKYEETGNQSIILKNGVWRWNESGRKQLQQNS